jgi:hypothetical protein
MTSGRVYEVLHGDNIHSALRSADGYEGRTLMIHDIIRPRRSAQRPEGAEGRGRRQTMTTACDVVTVSDSRTRLRGHLSCVC